MIKLIVNENAFLCQTIQWCFKSPALCSNTIYAFFHHKYKSINLYITTIQETLVIKLSCVLLRYYATCVAYSPQIEFCSASLFCKMITIKV